MLNKLYTGHYRYSGPDRIDITVKGQDPIWKVFAPTWDMVMGVKRGTLTEAEYVERYITILNNVPQHIWDRLFQMETITFVCFCPNGAFCHRNILMNYLCNSIPGIQYLGWRQ